MEKMISFLSRLVAVPTDVEKKENYVKCARLIEREAKRRGLVARTYVHTPKDGKGRANVVVEVCVGAEKTLLIATHYDVVPAGEGWKKNPFKMVVERGRAYGRGTSDDKGAIACAIEALEELKKRKSSGFNLILAATCDEEVGGNEGLGYLINKGFVRPDCAIVLDAGITPAIASSGVVFGRINVHGKQGHAGWPRRCVNALELSIPLMENLLRVGRRKKLSRFWIAGARNPEKVYRRFSFTMIKSGMKANIIPGECEITFDMRLIPEEDARAEIEKLSSEFYSLIRKLGIDADIEFFHVQPGYYTDAGNWFVRYVGGILDVGLNSTMGGNDGSHLSRKGIPVVCFGPTRGENNAHGKDEFVYIDDLHFVRDKLIEVAEGWVEKRGK
ncbi:MAG: M20/M25/M40 family metallo-hydrolase [Candidatus Micrarchaeia archaeon]